MSGAFENVRLSVVNHVAWLEFARPPVNAFNRAMVDETFAAIRQALADPGARVLVIASAVEKYFSAGADLTAFAALDAGQMRDWITFMHEIARTLRGAGGSWNVVKNETPNRYAITPRATIVKRIGP